jgi:FkbM family methyltransferase
MDIINLKFNNLLKIAIPSIDSSDNMYHSIVVQNSLRNDHIWSKEETSLFIDILNKNSKNNNDYIIVDVGSNTGYFSCIALSYNYNTIAIEANNVYKKYVDKTLEINNFDMNKLIYYENFASNIETEILFDGWSGYNSLMDYSNRYYVKTVSIDNICNNKNILILKIDVEGAEPNVFKSAHNLIINKKIKYIIFELTYIINNKLIREQIDILPYLKFNNYDIYEIVENQLIYISNIRQRVNYWVHEFKTNHKVKNPNLQSAGTNLLAILKDNFIPNVNLIK